MLKLPIGRPETSEYAPHAKAYVALVDAHDVVDGLKEQIEKTIGLFSKIDDLRASEFSYAPGKWTLKQVLGHLCDTERVFAYRALRIARGDSTPLPGFEQDDYVKTAGSNERNLLDLIEEFRSIRQSTLYMVRAFPHGAWGRSGTVNDQVLTVRGIIFTAAGHELHHYKILQERYGLT